MPAQLSVAQRILLLKNIFNNFGLPVADNSILDQLIHSEFGRGKRSNLNKILIELHTETEAAVLSRCIGFELSNLKDDIRFTSLGRIMQDQLPSLLQIIDIKQQTNKRVELLQQLLLHFEHKLSAKQESVACPEQYARLLRSLAVTRQQLQHCMAVQAVAEVIEGVGTILSWQHLAKFGRILQAVTPALVAVDQPEISVTQKINHCLRAINVLGVELDNLHLQRAAKVLDDLHWLGQVILPQTKDHATIEQALQNLNLSIGNMSLRALSVRAKALGLSENELIQMLYSVEDLTKLSKPDQDLLTATQQNKQLAAVCGLLAKMGQDIECQELANFGVAGLCLTCLHQTYCEFATGNLSAVTFSESLGVILTGVGTITKNEVLTNFGQAIVSGVATYAGLAAVPGGAAIAIPLALCTALGSAYMQSKAREVATPSGAANSMYLLVNHFLLLRSQMQQQFNDLYAYLQLQYSDLLQQLDLMSNDLRSLIQYNSNYLHLNMQHLTARLDGLHYSMQREFQELYFEYIRQPLEELDYHQRYARLSTAQLEQNKFKLSMWLLYKSKHHKARGVGVLNTADAQQETTNLNLMLRENYDSFEMLPIINAYMAKHFMLPISSALPQVPAWVLAADAYSSLPSSVSCCSVQEVRDIILIGQEIVNFISQLATNFELFRILHRALNIEIARVQAVVMQQQTVSGVNCLADLHSIAMHPHNNLSIDIVTSSAPANEQLENFTPFTLDFRHQWQLHLRKLLPTEFELAVALGLAEFDLSVAIDNSVNRFIHTRIPYHGGNLPDGERDVIFRIEVRYKLGNTSALLFTAWFAYDLGTAQRRFEEYYQAKLEFPLSHTRYLWLDVNGNRNQVEGHDITTTNKTVVPAKTANMYKAWLQKAVPISTPELMSRMRQNPHFMAKCTNMLQNGDFVQLQSMNILAMRLQISNALQQIILQRRTTIANQLLNDQSLRQCIVKIDAYLAIDTAYRNILHPVKMPACKSTALDAIIIAMQAAENVTVDYSQQLNKLFAPIEWQQPTVDQVNQHPTFIQLQLVLARLRLLQIKLPGFTIT